jgi:amino acid adenylation domain-containing protein
MKEDLQQQLDSLSAEDLALLELLLAGEDVFPTAVALDRDREETMYPLSYAQERLWFIHQLEPDLPLYNINSTYRLTGPLNVPALARSLQEIVNRHEVLRTNLVNRDGQPRQVIRDNARFDVPLVDLGHLPPAEREETALALAREEHLRLFDLERDLMLRAKLLRLDDKTHLLVIVMHHIASDGWSIGVFWRELKALYGAFAAGEPSPLLPLSLQYTDFAVWQREWLQGAVLAQQLDYWRRRLAGLPELDLPTDYPRPAINKYSGATRRFELPAALAPRLQDFARREGVTLYMLLLAVFQVLLYRYTGQEDFAVGSPIANRNRRETEELIGFFANTLVMRADLAGNPSFRELLRRVREFALGAYDHQDLPFEKLVAELHPQRDQSRNPLFQVMFVLQNTPDAVTGLPGIAVEKVSTESRNTSKFDLLLGLMTRTDSLVGIVEYRTDLFAAVTIDRLIEHFRTLLVAAIANPDCPVGELSMLTTVEERHILAGLSVVPEPPRSAPPVHRLFEIQVAHTPDAVALVERDRRLTFQQLNRRANRIARRLSRLGVGPDVCVALQMSRETETFLMLLAILKAGGAYLPLDPLNPPDRLGWMLRESRAPFLVMPPGRVPPFDPGEVTVLAAEGLEADAADLPDNNLDPVADGDHLAYVMYTSGSTGRPKGIAMRHGALANLIAWHLDHPILGRPARTIQFSALSFDVSFQEIFVTWCSGGQLVLLDLETRLDPRALADVIRDAAIERLYLPGVALQQLAPFIAADAGGYALQTVVTAGEQLHVTRDVRRMAAALDGFTLHNHYGPTEAHVVSHFILEGDPEGWPDLPPIGRPIPGARLYVLDQHRQLLPVGYPGELAIGGAVLARGYLHRPDLTEERFVADPFAREAGGRMYLTGDLARWLPYGELEYLGRLDRQVKIRGFRIEPGEIESAIGRHPAIREVAVLANEDLSGNRQLVAYVVPSVGELDPDPAELRAFLSKTLPDYMIPAAFVTLPRLPLTAHGKVDRAVLPAPDAGARPAGNVGVAPLTPEEEAVAAIWREVLRQDQIGVDDNFFDLGGHSLLATQVVSRIEQQCGRRLPLSLLFTAPTVAQLAAHLKEPVGLERSSTLVALHTDGHRPPFFCVHGFGGGVLGYADLARLLGPDQPFYGLQANGLNGDEPVDTTIADMAARYIAAMREVQPHGPYRLGGYCFGGVVAFEMARQLTATGEDAELVAIIEGYAPLHHQRGRPSNAWHRWRTVWQNLPYWLHDYWDLGIEGVRLRIERKGRIWRKQLMKALGRDVTYEPQDVIVDDLSILPDHHRQLMQIHLSAMRRYDPGPLDGGVTLFAARGKTISAALFGSTDPEQGWGALARGGVEVRVVDGGHRNVHLKPHVASLAAAIDETLRALDEVTEQRPGRNGDGV